MDDTTPTPAVGQVWQDNDPRAEGRYLRIVDIDASRATARPVTYDSTTGVVADLPGTRPSRIRLDRFRPTSNGYRYVGQDGDDR